MAEPMEYQTEARAQTIYEFLNEENEHTLLNDKYPSFVGLCNAMGAKNWNVVVDTNKNRKQKRSDFPNKISVNDNNKNGLQSMEWKQYTLDSATKRVQCLKSICKNTLYEIKWPEK
eukprot:UN13296